MYEYEPQQNWNPWDGEQSPTPRKKTQAKGGLSAAGIIALVLVCALVGCAAGYGGSLLAAGTNPGSLQQNQSAVYMGDREPTQITQIRVPSDQEMTKAEVYAANVNSTVGITTSVTTNFWGYQTTSAASGSGFVISKDGYILTNYHVIENSSAITVSMYDGSAYDATLIGFDAANDIAVLKIDADDLTPVVIGDSDKMRVGDEVVAIGNPLGELTFSLTAGAVSAMNRAVTMSTGVTMNLIQTDCAINSGNSGGALFNLYGEVIGITNAKHSGTSSSGASIDNIGFAIPINDVWGIITSILEKGYISKPYIGVTVTNVSAETQSYGLPQGAAVREVTQGSPAAQAGLQANDIITSVNGTEITGSNDLVNLVSRSNIGDTLSLQVYRQGQTIELTLTVGEKIQSSTGESISSGTAEMPNGFGN